jgi:hypothetical protein
MKRVLKNTFIPHHGNGFKPHLLREYGALALLILIAVLIPLGAHIHTSYVATSDFFAIITSSVLVELTNAERTRNGLTPLSINPLLEEAARRKAIDMAVNQYFAHSSPEGITPWDWMRSLGYRFRYAGENLAIDFSDSEDVQHAWLTSPGHRANILNEGFTEIGIVALPMVLNGRETIVVVEMFGTPQYELLAPGGIAEAKPAPPTADEPNAEVLGAATVDDTNEMYVAAPEPAAPIRAVPEVAEPALPPDPVNFLTRLITYPVRVLEAMYVALALLIALAVALALTIEFKRQHPKHVLYGVLLLLIIAVSFAVTRSVLIPSAAIA